MALQQLPGLQSGFTAKRYSSLNERAIGKLTDMNHISQVTRHQEPAKYDKDVITLYSQTSLKSVSDFQQMLMKSKPYEIPYGAPDTWDFEVNTVFKFPKIVAVPEATRTHAKPGIDQQEFELVFDKDWFFKDQIITADLRYGQEFILASDGEPYDGGFIYKATLHSQNPVTDFVDKRWLAQGTEYQLIRHVSGEFDQEGAGLGPMGDRIRLYESLGAGALKEHTVTGWAAMRGIDPQKDLIVYAKMERNEVGQTVKAITWEPFIERMLKEELLNEGMRAAIWEKGGTSRGSGKKQEIRKVTPGLYWRMRNNGNYVSYPRGSFSINLLRNVFGDLFYRRVSMGERRVKLYTNEAGFNVFDQAAKKDLLGAGITLTDMGTGNGFIEGSGQSRMFNFGFDRIKTRETGIIELVHLTELDQPSTSTEFGQNKRSTPIFIVLDLTSPDGGIAQDNIRLVRRQGVPNLMWSYQDGRMHHLGPMVSQGHTASNSFSGYKIMMETRWDIFIEDMSRCVLIEEEPQF